VYCVNANQPGQILIKLFLLHHWRSRQIEHSVCRWHFSWQPFPALSYICEKTRHLFHNTSFFSLLMNGPNKLECLSLTSFFQPSATQHSCLLGPFVGYKSNGVLWIPTQEHIQALYWHQALHINIMQSRLRNLPKEKKSSLLYQDNGDEKKFYKIDFSWNILLRLSCQGPML
jgi:hypothetical protein